jgi:hypothetical protein
VRAGALAALALACGSPGGEGPPPPAAGPPVDTLRGIVDVVGAEPATWVVMRAAPADVPLLGGTTLRRLVGLEVVVRGRRTPDGFQVRDFAVRAADGVPVLDGTAALRDGRPVLVVEGGRALPAPFLPVPPGTRLWLVGPLDRPPGAYGVLEP